MPKSKPLTFAELAALLPRMAATAKALAAASRRGTTTATPASRGRRRKRRRMSPAASAKLRNRVLAMLSSKKGLALGEVVKRAGSARSAVAFQLRQLRSQKKARVVGDRRKARWFA